MIGGVAAVILLGIAGFFIYRKRRNVNGQKAQSDSYEAYGPNQDVKSNYREVVELSDSQVVELPTDPAEQESAKPRNGQRFELP